MAGLGGRGVIDLTLGIAPGTLVWPGDPGVEVEPWASLDAGDQAAVSALRLGSHTGTHVDPPAHLLPGEDTVDRLPLDLLVGPATVVDLRGVAGPVEARHLEEAFPAAPVRRALLRTDNSVLWSPPPASVPEDYVALTGAAARWLVDRGVGLVGFDFLSIDAPGAGDLPVHRVLLSAGVVLVEGLDLSAAEPGDGLLACLPLKLVGGDGAPARCVLVEEPWG
ncbi:MAG: cyclase family protein [Acidimicrobiales bacterium]